MKKLKSILKLRNRFIDIATEFDKLLQETDIMTNEEHQKILLDDKLKLLYEISQDEKLDFELLKNKYLNITSEKQIEKKEIGSELSNKDDLLNSIIINKIIYYYEPKENGNIYNDKSQIVGRYINNKFNFNK
jgi:hypothetical protein